MSNCSFKDPGISQPDFHRYLWEHSNRFNEVSGAGRCCADRQPCVGGEAARRRRCP
jgi:hypothetical protein